MTPARSSTSWKDKERLDLPTIIGPDGQDYVTDLLQVEFRASRKRSFPGRHHQVSRNSVRHSRLVRDSALGRRRRSRHTASDSGVEVVWMPSARAEPRVS